LRVRITGTDRRIILVSRQFDSFEEFSELAVAWNADLSDRFVAGVNKPPFLSSAADIPTFQNVRLPGNLKIVDKSADGSYAFSPDGTCSPSLFSTNKSSDLSRFCLFMRLYSCPRMFP
jgi:hypothetical protein